MEGVRDNRGHWIDLADDVKSKTSQDQPQQQQQQQIVIPNGDSKQAMSDADNVADTDADADAKADAEAAAEASVNGLNVVTKSAVTNNIAIASRPSSNQPSDDDEDVGDNDEDDDAIEDDASDCGVVDDDDDGTVTHTENGHAASRSSSSSSCFSSTNSSTISSRLSTPPPTGEDDSTPVSPSKTLQVQLVAANLNALSQGKAMASAQKQRCKNCQQLRKTSSLKGPQELNGCRTVTGEQKKDATLCKSTPAISHQHQHHHSHNHNHSHSHSHSHQHHHLHSHHNHHHSHNLQQHHHIIGGGIGSASIGGSGLIGLSTESDKIPKIVGKLGNLDGLTFTNGHGLPFNYPQQQLPQQQQHHHHLLARRHSETNSNGSPTALGAEK